MTPPKFQFISGNLALDFVNTVGDRLSQSRDYFRSDEDLRAWSRLAGLSGVPSKGVALKDALRLRESLYGIFRASFESRRIPVRDLAVLNALAQRSRASWKLQKGKNGFAWRWTGAGGISYSLGRIAEAAVELLLSSDLDLIRQCNDRNCGWLFIDHSQGQRRRWCSMQDCGNRAKVKSFHRRQARKKR